METLIIIPAYNEEKNIIQVIEDIRINYAQYDYVVINDGSKDKTAEICRRNSYNLLDLPVNLGLAGAFQAGIRYAYCNGYDAAVQLDGDGQHDPRYIEGMISQCVETNSDIVIGSRFKEKKRSLSARMLGNTLLQFAIFLTTGKKMSDPTSGMRLYNRKMIELFAENINFGPEPDTMSYLLRCGIRVTEVQVDMGQRIAGESYLNLTRSIQYMLHMFTSILFIQQFRKRNV